MTSQPAGQKFWGKGLAETAPARARAEMRKLIMMNEKRSRGRCWYVEEDMEEDLSEVSRGVSDGEGAVGKGGVVEVVDADVET